MVRQKAKFLFDSVLGCAGPSLSMLSLMLIINMKRVVSVTVKLTALLKLMMSVIGSLHSLAFQTRKLPSSVRLSGLVMIARPERAQCNV